MTKFIDVSNIDEKKEKKETVFTDRVTLGKIWEKTRRTPKDYQVVKYLGKCSVDGHMFVAHNEGGCIEIFKGTKGDEFN